MRVDADDFARPCSCGREHHIDVREIVIESGAIGKLEKEMSDGDLKECISPLLICDTNSYKATEELMEDIYDRCQVLILDAEVLRQMSVPWRSWRIIWKRTSILFLQLERGRSMISAVLSPISTGSLLSLCPPQPVQTDLLPQ